MTSPKKSLDTEKETTLFADLAHIEKQTSRMSRNLIEDVEAIRRLQAEYGALEKDAKVGAEEFQVRASVDIRMLEEKMYAIQPYSKNYLTIQKGEYSRLAVQVNQIISSQKELNSQLQFLNGRFEQYRKNVGL